MKLLLGDLVPLLTSFDLSFFNGIRLEELVKFDRVAPVAVEVVVLQFSAGDVAEDRKSPAGQLHCQAGHGVAEQFDGALRRLRQLQPLAGSLNGHRIANLRLNLDDMTQRDLLSRSRECACRKHGREERELGTPPETTIAMRPARVARTVFKVRRLVGQHLVDQQFADGFFVRIACRTGHEPPTEQERQADCGDYSNGRPDRPASGLLLQFGREFPALNFQKLALFLQTLVGGAGLF